MKEVSLPKGKVALVDDADFDLVSQYTWYVQGGRKSQKSHGQNTWYVFTNVIDPHMDKVRYTYDVKTGKKYGPYPRRHKMLYMHILIMEPKDEEQVDHKDHDGLNNQRYNLRIATRSQNQYNGTKAKLYAGHKPSSVFRGVSWQKREHRWRAQIQVESKRIYLGGFKVEKEAALEYNLAAAQHFGEFANLNPI